MAIGLAAHGYKTQSQPLEGTQQAFRRWVCGGAFRIARIQARQLGAYFAQTPPHDVLQQRQDAQADRQPANQPGRTIVIRQVHRRQTQATAFEPPKAALDQVLVTIGQHRLLQRQGGCGPIGAIDAPTQAALSGLECEGVALHGDLHRTRRPGFRRASAILAHLPHLDRLGIGQRQQPLDLITLQQRHGGLLQGRYVRKRRLALFRGIQGAEGGLRLRQPLVQGGRRRGGVGQRAHDQAPFGPGEGAAGHGRRQLLRTFEPFGDLRRWLARLVAVNRRQGLFFRPYRLQISIHGRLRELGQRQGRQIKIATRRQMGPRRQRHHFAVANVQQPPLSHPSRT